ncbi:hypothetical protein ILUMI_13919 [Ignelater luminosus]|uniref:DDE-1 domain-containing protein n=1 Tax=Ignelater luminosus TaxID=2038154 RepID=A0A8K0CRF9_IGNLU|nr:hypothetical protein ILUMI_13919 [Ignelater luminosus]
MVKTIQEAASLARCTSFNKTTANGSGWMNEETFVMFVHHFIKYSLQSPDNPVLLLLDNHSSHLSVEAIDLPTQERFTNTNDQRIQENTSSVPHPQEGISMQFSPEALRPLPKTSNRKPNSKERQRRTTAILMNTDEKIHLEEEKQNVNEKKKRKAVKRNFVGKKKTAREDKRK